MSLLGDLQKFFRIKNFALLIICFILVFGCATELEESNEILVYPNPYNPNEGFLNIKDKNGNSLGNQIHIHVYDFNLNLVYSGKLENDQYPGIDNSGEKLKAGLYYLRIMKIDTTGEKVVTHQYRLVVP